MNEAGDTHGSYNTPFSFPENMSPESPPDHIVGNPLLPSFFQFVSEMFSLSKLHKCSCIVHRRRKKNSTVSNYFVTIKHANVGAAFNKLLWTFRRKERMNQQKIRIIKGLLQNQYFEPLIENESETGVWNFPWNTHRVLKNFRGCSGKRRLWVKPSPRWWEEKD